MYKWDKVIDIEKIFLNQTLDSILFSQNTMVLHISNSSSVTVFWGCELHSIHGESESISFPIGKTNIMSLIGTTISNSKIINETDLILVFTNGYELTIKGSNKSFECYTVRFENREIVI